MEISAENAKVGFMSPPISTRFKPGNRANPGGKPLKARNKLQAHFLNRLAADFERYGIYAIARCRRDDPARYLTVVASLMPKEVEIKIPLAEISDDELDAAYAAAKSILDARGSGAIIGDGEGGSRTAQPIALIPAVPEAT